MAIYIHFENGKQVETTEQGESPGADWVEAPASFSWDKQYYLNAKGKATAMSAKALAEEALEEGKQQKKEDIKAQADIFRASVYPTGQPKNDEYRLKADAARRLLDLEKNKQKITKDNPDYILLSFEAEAREIEVIELARQINEKSNKTLMAVAIIAAFEAKGKKLIAEAADIETIENELETLIEETEEKLKDS